ncbi:mannose-6-phosphate isomerase, class I [Pseudolysinimonas yzui]|uniref:mannose-6-phosphate isomerase n=1 Tax=Pseudolysinimonas yzui TaxID=2708254 RepID=A0A8J3GQR6_9MICO|nr:mannose-6-phosphate isomerase, class I [Pseudolysinimonas yzui]GHF15565.1 mannose-6-phosphate isomerase, class I [Pseudolysinimonas yzui]
MAALFVEITNEPRDYAWGSPTLIPELLGVAPDGRPQAEIWLGTHPGSPARLVGRDGDLRDVAGELPFLLKILAAGAPLSLQAHPTTAQAQEGFARENAAGIPIDAPHRNYKDPHAKPEMIYALSDEFRALCGFRPVTTTRAVLDAGRAGLLPELRTDADIRPVFEWLLSADPEVASVVEAVTAAAQDAEGDSWATVRLLAEHYPGDPGIAISLLLNTIVLRRGEALYLPAGNIHAYLSGLGIELMGPSDNVLRCGLTPKHVDVPELLRVVDFTPVGDPRLRPTSRSDGASVFAPAGAGFVLTVLEGPGARLSPATPAIVTVLSGSVRLGDVQLGFGRFAFVDGDLIATDSPGLAVVATSS